MEGEKKKICEKCNIEFSCYNDGCWCSGLPNILPLDPNKDCFCPSCLKAEVKAKTEFFVKNQTLENMALVEKLGPVEDPVQDIDFYYNEEGLHVWTGWYLLRRGFCCGKFCKNCPF
jgi:hypothetical protein